MSGRGLVRATLSQEAVLSLQVVDSRSLRTDALLGEFRVIVSLLGSSQFSLPLQGQAMLGESSFNPSPLKLQLRKPFTKGREIKHLILGRVLFL